MTVIQAITHLPGGKPEVVSAQIHGKADDITVLECVADKNGNNPKLYVTKGDRGQRLIEANYTLGTVFTATVVANSGGFHWYYNGAHVTTIQGKDPGCYFKAGCYTQANKSNGSGYGEVVIYGLSVSHT